MPEHQQIQQSKKSDTIFQKQATPAKQIPISNPMAIIQRAKINPKSLTHADVMQLQRTIGNRAVGRLLSEIGMIPSTAKPVQRQEIPEEETCPSCMQRQEIPEEEEPLQGKMIETIQRQEIPEEEEPLQGKFESKLGQAACPSCSATPIVQRQEIPEEEEPLQGKMADTIQRQEIPEEEPLQGKFENSRQVTCPSCSAISLIQRQEIPNEEEPLQTKRENNTGLPDNLKAGVESLSGIDMSDVRVHYNSSKPAEVGALAYTQGTNIHVASGQERHLPHEAWHVVQQKQVRVQATTQMKGLGINDDPSLEYEADMMGAKTAQFVSLPDEEMLQGEFGERVAQKAEKAPNNTGMPDNLKAGIENLSGMSIDGVKVRYNSGKPENLDALTYAQGNDIHLGPGQERRLPHEAWHVVQQEKKIEKTGLEGSPGCGAIQRNTRGKRTKSKVSPEHEELTYTEEAAKEGRDALKQQALDEIGREIQSVADTTPHVAISLTGSNAYVAININSKLCDSYSGKEDSSVGEKAAWDQKVKGMQDKYKVSLDQQKEKEGNKPIKDWLARYKEVVPKVLPKFESIIDAKKTGSTAYTHAEQLIVLDIQDLEPPWHHKPHKPEGKEEEDERGWRVIRIGGTLLDCARCHADHHGNMESFPIKGKQSIRFNKETGSPIFSAGGFGGSDKKLFDRFKRILRTSGMHPGSDGARKIDDKNQWTRTGPQQAPITSRWLLSPPPTEPSKLTKQERIEGVRLPAVSLKGSGATSANSCEGAGFPTTKKRSKIDLSPSSPDSLEEKTERKKKKKGLGSN